MGLFGLSSKLAHMQQSSLDNLSKGSQISYRIPYFDVFDARLPELGVPVACKITVVYAIEDIPLFKSLNKAESMNDEVLQNKMKSSITKYVKGCITNIPEDCGIPLVQMERRVIEISDYIGSRVAPEVERVFAIKIRSFDIESIDFDKESAGYIELQSLTSAFDSDKRRAMHSIEMDKINNQRSDINFQHQINQGNLCMDIENKRETLRIQREEMQRAAKLQTEQTFLDAHQANLEANSMNNDAFQMPSMPSMNAKNAPPIVSYMLAINNQQAGPFNWNQLQQFVKDGRLTRQTYVWKQGMANWELAGNIHELSPLFLGAAPQMPPHPPFPGQ